ncbi:ankyrin repeat-containing domain protein [Baffinella frigidus]|nr:ankyrin repeat-containing domain protein [Cryptophyta sp. CCMP2293]
MDRGQLVGMLLDAGADVSITDIWGRTPMHYANNVDIANILLSYGACLNTLDNRDQTILHFAVQGCNHNMSCFLVENGADCSDVNVNTQDENGETLLYYAVTHAFVKVTQRLLQNGALTNVYNTTTGMTPIHIAVAHGNPVTIRLLFRYGANVEQLGFGGVTPLFFAIIFGHEYIAEMLIDEYHADVKISLFTHSRATLLHVTAHRDCPWTVDLLVAYGADINATDSHGNTPLHYAIDRDHVDVVVSLLKRGAKLWSKQPTGELHQVINIHGWRNRATSTTMSLIRHVYQRIEDAAAMMELKKKAFTQFDKIEAGLIDMILQDSALDTSLDKINVRTILEEIEREITTNHKTILNRFPGHKTIVGKTTI